MIAMLSFIIIIAFYLFLFLSLYAEGSLFFNLVLLGIFLILCSIDLKKKGLQKYYIISLSSTAIIFILSDTAPIKAVLGLFSKVSLFVVAFIFVYLTAHMSKLADNFVGNLIERYIKS